MAERKLNLLLCCTGSVATIKVPHLAECLKKLGSDVLIVPTLKAEHFLKTMVTEDSGYLLGKDGNSDSDISDIELIRKYFSEQTFVTEDEEWSEWQKRGDPIKHIKLRDWADILIIAPLDANTLAKLSNGLCDNLLTCIIRAWDLKKPLYFCPAMNTEMFIHPITAQHISALKSYGYREIPAISKKLMCGQTGIGAMAQIGDIVNILNTHMNNIS